MDAYLEEELYDLQKSKE